MSMAVDNPPDDEPKSERFNMFISKSEMAAIDEWAWKSRVRSKSEAVRRLVQIGLRAQKGIEEFGPLVAEIADASAKGELDLVAFVEARELPLQLDVHEALEAMKFLIRSQKQIAPKARVLSSLLYYLLIEIEPLANGGKFSVALNEAEKNRVKSDQVKKAWRELMNSVDGVNETEPSK